MTRWLLPLALVLCACAPTPTVHYRGAGGAWRVQSGAQAVLTGLHPGEEAEARSWRVDGQPATALVSEPLPDGSRLVTLVPNVLIPAGLTVEPGDSFTPVYVDGRFTGQLVGQDAGGRLLVQRFDTE